MEFSYTAIILKKRDIGETDRLYTFATKEGGKICAVGRGTRRPTAKLAGHLETLNFVNVSVERGRGRGNISSVIVEESFPVIRSQGEWLRTALEGVSFFDSLVGEQELDPKLFFLLFDFLQAIDSLNSTEMEMRVIRSRLFFSGFLWKLLDALGYCVETRSCVVGGERLSFEEEYFFSPDAGGIVCVSHGSLAKRAIPFSKDSIKLLRIFLANTVISLQKIIVREKTLRSVECAFLEFFQWHGHRV